MISNSGKRDFALELDKRFDANVRPQDDFFDYVNGKWLRDNPIPPSESRWGTFYVLRDQSWARLNSLCESLQDRQIKTGSIEQKIADYYWSGINKDSLEKTHIRQLKALLSKIQKIKSIRDLYLCIGQLHSQDVDVSWNLVVDSDDKDSTIYVLRFVQDGITLPDRDYYLDKTKKMQDTRDELKKHISRISALVPDIRTNNLPEDILNFETALATHSMTSIELRDMEKCYHPHSVGQLRNKHKNIDWDAYFEGLGWQPGATVIVNQVEFLKFIDSISTIEHLEAWKKYLAWRVTVSLAGFLSESYARANFEFFGKILSGKKDMQPLWKRVSICLDSSVGFAVGQLYAAQYFPESSKAKVEAIVESIRETFAERIKSLGWMQPKTKLYALKKLANMLVVIGYSRDDRDYTKLTISKESFLGNYLSACQLETVHHLSKVGSRPRRDELHMTPQTVNAYHDPSQLVIAFPAGILQYPFFDENAPDIMNYAGIGAVIGHELTHGFDDQGSQHDANGNIKNWRTESDKKAFELEAKKLSDLADKFEVIPGVFMKGGLVLGEVIADVGGAEIALDAYKRRRGGKVSEEEVRTFYASFAVCECHETTDEFTRQLVVSDPHPNERFRVNGVLQHCDDFYRVFDITSKDKLYLDSSARARIW